MFWPSETRTSTCRNFATISSGLYRFLAIAGLLDDKDIPQVGPLQRGRIRMTMSISVAPYSIAFFASVTFPKVVLFPCGKPTTDTICTEIFCPVSDSRALANCTQEGA